MKGGQNTMKKLMYIMPLFVLSLLSLSMISAATFVTQSTRFMSDGSISQLNAWEDKGQGQVAFSHQEGRTWTGFNGRVTSTGIVSPNVQQLVVQTSAGSLAYVYINKIAKTATVSTTSGIYIIPINVLK